jgi:hypothetical protein
VEQWIHMDSELKSTLQSGIQKSARRCRDLRWDMYVGTR